MTAVPRDCQRPLARAFRSKPRGSRRWPCAGRTAAEAGAAAEARGHSAQPILAPCAAL